MCWGNLSAVERRPSPAPPTYQEQAARKAAAAQKRFDELVAEVRRASALLGKWQKKAAYFAQRAAMTDEQLAAEREARQQARIAGKGRRRKLALEGGL